MGNWSVTVDIDVQADSEDAASTRVEEALAVEFDNEYTILTTEEK